MHTDIPDTVFTFLQSVDAPVQTDASDSTAARDALRTLLDDLDTAARVDPTLEPTPEILTYLLSFYKATQLYCKSFTYETCERLRRAAAANTDDGEEDANTFSHVVLDVFGLTGCDQSETEQCSARDILMDECREAAVLDFLASRPLNPPTGTTTQSETYPRTNGHADQL